MKKQVQTLNKSKQKKGGALLAPPSYISKEDLAYLFKAELNEIRHILEDFVNKEVEQDYELEARRHKFKYYY